MTQKCMGWHSGAQEEETGRQSEPVATEQGAEGHDNRRHSYGSRVWAKVRDG